jgi:hypothetical protein
MSLFGHKKELKPFDREKVLADCYALDPVECFSNFRSWVVEVPENSPFRVVLESQGADVDFLILKKKDIKENIVVEGNPFTPYESIKDKCYHSCYLVKVAEKQTDGDCSFFDMPLMAVDSVEKLLDLMETL